MPRITKSDDLVQLNRQFARLDLLIKQHEDLRSKLENIATQVKNTDVKHAPQTLNNVVFTWDGPTTTLSWTAGSIKNKNNQNIPVKAGHLNNLDINTYYWLAWNDAHNIMVASKSVDGLLQNQNNFVLSQVYTGTAVQTGTAGGGGSSNTGAADLSGGRYKYFAPC